MCGKFFWDKVWESQKKRITRVNVVDFSETKQVDNGGTLGTKQVNDAIEHFWLQFIIYQRQCQRHILL